jgi:hypothetical protein
VQVLGDGGVGLPRRLRHDADAGGQWLARAVVVGGLLFGRVEAAVHARLCLLARLDWGRVGRRLGRQSAVSWWGPSGPG